MSFNEKRCLRDGTELILRLKRELSTAESALAEAKADKMQWVDEATKARDALAELELALYEQRENNA